jgi:ATP-dependent DNA helicase RecG
LARGDPGRAQGEDGARDRLAYDELLANSLALMLVRASNRRAAGQAAGRWPSAFAPVAAFRADGAQKRAIAEVEGDLMQSAPMLRLLQGDVGSGKTVVALESMLIAVEAGAQAALLAPPKSCAPAFCDIAADVGAHGCQHRPADRAGQGPVREAYPDGPDGWQHRHGRGHPCDLSGCVVYKDLALVVIDEQHRFGVGQRLMLTQKGKRTPHCLAMTATPIPRTLTLAQYGEMDVSKLDELPPGRQAIDTRVVAQERLGDVANALRRHFETGQQAYWVCPWSARTRPSTWPPPRRAMPIWRRSLATMPCWSMAR